MSDSTLADYRTIPGPWRALVSEINGGRIPDGEPGIRDVDAPCEAFKPYGKPWQNTEEFGHCETDGHYLCLECVEIDLRTFRRRRDLCEDCGAKLIRERREFGPEDVCSAHCDRPAVTS